MAEIAIAGGHGQIAMLLGERLSASGNAVFGLIRDPAQEDDLHRIDVEPVVCDLESGADVAAAISGADAVVFAAGAGPGSGAERKRTMDHEGAVKLIEACKAEGVRRYVMVSAMGAVDPPPEPEGDVFGEYLRAKGAADRALAASGLEYTIVRPGRLTDDPGTGLVELGERLQSGEVPRADVAAVIGACLDLPHTIGWSFDLLGGETPISQALESL
jgi:nucleoside-diphosphate-sugar epimerase